MAESREQVPADVKFNMIRIHFFDFLLIFLGSEIVISLILVALTAIGLLPSGSRMSVYITGLGLAVFCVVVFIACRQIYARESLPWLYFLTSFSALVIVLIFAYIAVFLPFNVVLVWCFAPLRVLRMLGTSNGLSITLCGCAVALVIVVAFFVAQLDRRRWLEYMDFIQEESEDYK